MGKFIYSKNEFWNWLSSSHSAHDSASPNHLMGMCRGIILSNRILCQYIVQKVCQVTEVLMKDQTKIWTTLMGAKAQVEPWSSLIYTGRLMRFSRGTVRALKCLLTLHLHPFWMEIRSVWTSANKLFSGSLVLEGNLVENGTFDYKAGSGTCRFSNWFYTVKWICTPEGKNTSFYIKSEYQCSRGAF